MMLKKGKQFLAVFLLVLFVGTILYSEGLSVFAESGTSFNENPEETEISEEKIPDEEVFKEMQEIPEEEIPEEEIPEEEVPEKIPEEEISEEEESEGVLTEENPQIQEQTEKSEEADKPEDIQKQQEEAVEEVTSDEVTEGNQPKVIRSPRMRYSTSESYVLQLTKQWKTKDRITVANANIPFDRVEVEVVQFYKMGTEGNLTEKEINRDVLVLTKENNWTDSYAGEIKDYSLFKATAERVFIGETEVDGGDYDWSMGNFTFQRKYETADVVFEGRIQSCANTSLTVPGNNVVLVKLTRNSGYVIWMPYLDYLDETAKEAIKRAVCDNQPSGAGNISVDSIKFYNEVSNSMTGVTVTYLQDGAVQIDMAGSSVWAQLWYGPFIFADTTVEAGLVNSLNTDKKTDITVTKIWDDDNNKERPESVNIDVKNGNTIVKSIVLSENDNGATEITDDGNTWQQTITVPKYNSEGSRIQYTIEEEVPEFYEAEYEQSDLTVTNRRAQIHMKIEKAVKGNMGDRTQKFAFQLSLTQNGKEYTKTIKDINGKSYQAMDGVYVFELADSESITFCIPYGCVYSVTEDAIDYEASIKVNGADTENAEGVVEQPVAITFTNTKDMVIPTGISSDVAAYLIMIGFAAVTAIVYGMAILSKKSVRELNDGRGRKDE